jgi:misacylated tRNA(Ala) deacylase
MHIGTTRLYLQDDHCCEADATVVAVREGAIAVDQTCFYPGGGGQPPDVGSVRLGNGALLEITSAHADGDDVIWHVSTSALPSDIVGERVRLTIDRERRRALARYHTVLHVLNTIALRDYGGWITGVQIAPDYSRIDFKLDGFSAALCAELEEKVNTVLAANRPLKSYYIPEDEFRRRDDLLRTLEVKPPVVDGQVRVVEIDGFDAQACGGTHVSTTADVGRFSIFKTENKGKVNKRLYVRLA